MYYVPIYCSFREELSAQTRVSQKYESRTNDLRTMIENQKLKMEVNVLV